MSTGDLLRDEVNSGSAKGKELQEIMKSGKLVPLTEVLGLLKAAMTKNESANGFLIDGYPREVEQAIQFEKEVCPCTFLIYFDATDESMTKRLVNRGKTSGRADDNEATIKQRLVTFHANREPIMAHYGNKVVTINAERDPEVIFADVCAAIDLHTSK